ncbi:MAG: uridine kinase [Verrucomicrobiota bacterium]
MGKRSYIIGVCGGSGSGKTTLAEAILADQRFQPASGFSLDAYYRSPEAIPALVLGNYDHPEALDIAMCIEHLAQLSEGHAVRIPCYDFETHRRQAETESIEPTPYIVVDGVLLFAVPELVEQFDCTVFVDTPADIRLERRLRRDLATRGRNLGSILDQYVETVRPMHEKFVEPGRDQADFVVDGMSPFDSAIDTIANQLG